MRKIKILAAKNNNTTLKFVKQCAKWPQKATCHWYANPVRSHCPWSDDLGILTPVCVWLWLSFIFIVLFFLICSIFVRLFHSFRGALNDNLAIRIHFQIQRSWFRWFSRVRKAVYRFTVYGESVHVVATARQTQLRLSGSALRRTVNLTVRYFAG